MNLHFPGLAEPSAPSSPAAQARRAALVLHGMAPADRAWVLERMAPSQRDALQALLSELQALGIPPDPAGLDALATAAPDSVAAAPLPTGNAASSPPEADLLMALGAPGVAALARAWRAQPPLMVAQALCLRPWPWRAALLEQLPALQRRRVTDLLGTVSSGPSTAPALASAMLDGMRHCCDAPAVAAAGAVQGDGRPAGHRAHGRFGGWRWPWRRKEGGA
ncbi:hypothetical protein [Paracidovorax cattleyae]|uniref:Uncharacterized protein n=1 Tax=Paracidovorax cattleyae TaxID=80868 RepID=A0A1H0U8R2_9BURK|nr:hypothetical protein [Paracidovorax cattleyae]SDP62549.1 hypothetical protein SAMN04489708_11860 [Paracidovorax cattleyae]